MKPLIPLALTALALAAGCQDSGAPAGTSSALDLANGFNTVPMGFSEVQSTFADSTNSGWAPGEGGRGHHGGAGGMMCGGLGGLAGFGLGFERAILYATGIENIRDVIPYPRAPRQAEF